jgi:hypothetical protein
VEICGLAEHMVPLHIVPEISHLRGIIYFEGGSRGLFLLNRVVRSPQITSSAVRQRCHRKGRSEFDSDFHLDILPEGRYLHLGCLLKNNANASNCCRGPWTC